MDTSILKGLDVEKKVQDDELMETDRPLLEVDRQITSKTSKKQSKLIEQLN
jgi:hypothetical protein